MKTLCKFQIEIILFHKHRFLDATTGDERYGIQSTFPHRKWRIARRKRRGKHNTITQMHCRYLYDADLCCRCLARRAHQSSKIPNTKHAGTLSISWANVSLRVRCCVTWKTQKKWSKKWNMSELKKFVWRIQTFTDFKLKQIRASLSEWIFKVMHFCFLNRYVWGQISHNNVKIEISFCNCVIL